MSTVPAPERGHWSPKQASLIGIVIMLAFALPFFAFAANFRIGFDRQVARCLPHAVWLLTTHLPSSIERGRYYQYRAKNIAPIPDGMLVVKVAAGVPGDHVHVDSDGIRINGALWGPINPETLAKVGLTQKDIDRDYVIPESKVLVLGTLPRTWDGRYWGLLDEKQIVGTAWPIW